MCKVQHTYWGGGGWARVFCRRKSAGFWLGGLESTWSFLGPQISKLISLSLSFLMWKVSMMMPTSQVIGLPAKEHNLSWDYPRTPVLVIDIQQLLLLLRCGPTKLTSCCFSHWSDSVLGKTSVSHAENRSPCSDWTFRSKTGLLLQIAFLVFKLISPRWLLQHSEVVSLVVLSVLEKSPGLPTTCLSFGDPCHLLFGLFHKVLLLSWLAPPPHPSLPRRQKLWKRSFFFSLANFERESSRALQRWLWNFERTQNLMKFILCPCYLYGW